MMTPQHTPPLFACLYRPPAPDCPADAPRATLEQIAQQFSPRYERHHDGLVSIDVSGLERMLTGRPHGTRATAAFGEGGRDSTIRTIGEELRRHAASCGVRVHAAVAGTRMAALVLAHARPGITSVEPGHEASALAAVPIGILGRVADIAAPDLTVQPGSGAGQVSPAADSAIATFQQWGLKTLGELAALPAADLTSRLGRQAMVWQAIARGDDLRPLIPTLEEERFEGSIDLEWPIDGLEPLSFVLTRLLEPLSTRLERRDRGTAVLHVVLRLVTREPYVRRLELPSPIRDVRTLRTLALLDLESHPPGAAIDRVAVIIDPTPGRILQHTLFTRAQPTPEQLSTLVARLGALMGQDRIGAPAPVDSYRPDAFVMVPFATDHGDARRVPQPCRINGSSFGRAEQPGGSGMHADDRRQRSVGDQSPDRKGADSAASVVNVAEPDRHVVSTLRRCRQPVPARVALAGGQPVRVTTDRRGFAGGSVVRCAGPWRSSGNWWMNPPDLPCWDRDEWDVALSDGAAYRIFLDRDSGGWFIDAIVD